MDEFELSARFKALETQRNELQNKEVVLRGQIAVFERQAQSEIENLRLALCLGLTKKIA